VDSWPDIAQKIPWTASRWVNLDELKSIEMNYWWTEINWDELLMNYWCQVCSWPILALGPLEHRLLRWAGTCPGAALWLEESYHTATNLIQFVMFPSELQYATGCYRVLLFPPSLEVSTLGGRCWSWLVPRSLCYFGRSLESSALESLWLPWWRLSSYFDSSYFSVNLPFCIPACAIENV